MLFFVVGKCYHVHGISAIESKPDLESPRNFEEFQVPPVGGAVRSEAELQA